jgi:protein-disulfide isomerase
MENPALERDVVEWMWTNQRALTTDQVFEGVKAQFGLDVRARYAELLPAIVQSVDHGRRLGVSGTPTFFLNGRRLPRLPAEAMAAALEIEMRSAVAKEGTNAYRQ